MLTIVRSSILFVLYATLLLAMQLPGLEYASPAPDAKYVARQSTIIIRLADETPPAEWLENFIRVTGKKSGPVSGNVSLASDGKSIIFQPQHAFVAGDHISVELHLHAGDAPLSYQFSVCKDEQPAPAFLMPDEMDPEPAQRASLSKAAAAPRIMPNGVSVPADFPHINVTINKNPSAGYIWLNNWREQGPYNIIFDNDGSPVWYERFADGDRRRNFLVQKNGIITMLTRHDGERYLGYDQNFNLIDEFKPAGGYSNDEHELQVLENGHYLIIGRRNVIVDMSKIISGGKKNANVREVTVQEFTAHHEMIFNWPSLEHLADGLPFVELDDPRGDSFRFPHFNAVDVDDDGNLLVSSRHLSEVTKVNRQTGDIIWRLGGVHSDFTFINDPLKRFRNQHDIRSLGNGLYSVFDNGNNHNPSRSRGAIYRLDLDAMTATLVWEYRNPPGTNYSFYMGNVQKLPNGNLLINWAVGDRPKATEVTPDGDVVYEMNFVDGYHTYRTFRFPWNGVVEKPRLFVEPSFDKMTLIFNKFGDKNVDYYKIYADTRSRPVKLLDTSKTTMKSFSDFVNHKKYYFRVKAVDKAGAESAYSNIESATINFVEPGSNLIPNGDFAQGKDIWTYELQGAGRADWIITEQGEALFQITEGGSNVYDVQLRQNGMPLIEGESYIFEFDAWASNARSMEAKVGQDHAPYINYSKIGLSVLSRAKKHFSYTFKMEAPSDMNARVVFNMGASRLDVYLDNISLKQVVTSNVQSKSDATPQTVALLGNYPNPFNAATTVAFRTAHNSTIKLQIFNVMGRQVKSRHLGFYAAGGHRLNLDLGDLPSGVYFYRLSAIKDDGRRTVSALSKISLLK